MEINKNTCEYVNGDKVTYFDIFGAEYSPEEIKKSIDKKKP